MVLGGYYKGKRDEKRAVIVKMRRDLQSRFNRTWSVKKIQTMWSDFKSKTPRAVKKIKRDLKRSSISVRCRRSHRSSRPEGGSTTPAECSENVNARIAHLEEQLQGLTSSVAQLQQWKSDLETRLQQQRAEYEQRLQQQEAVFQQHVAAMLQQRQELEAQRQRIFAFREEAA